MTQQDLFSLFGMLDEVETAKQEKAALLKKEQEEKKAQQQEELKKKIESAKSENKSEKDAAPKKAVNTPDEFKPTEETMIRFMGDSLPVTDFFSPEELAEGLLVTKKDKEPERQPLTGEMLRSRMEKEFPELVKNHTEMVFLKAKNIVVPVMKAKAKGAEREALATSRASLYPVPYSLLNEFIALAKVFAVGELEVHADIYYLKEKNAYLLDVPQQRVERYQVEVTEPEWELANRLEGAIKLMEIHSHHRLLPIPSELDNRSERFPGMVYAIVGNMYRFFPEITVRRFESEDSGYSRLDPVTVFESPFSGLPEFDMASIEVISHD